MDLLLYYITTILFTHYFFCLFVCVLVFCFWSSRAGWFVWDFIWGLVCGAYLGAHLKQNKHMHNVHTQHVCTHVYTQCTHVKRGFCISIPQTSPTSLGGGVGGWGREGSGPVHPPQLLGGGAKLSSKHVKKSRPTLLYISVHMCVKCTHNVHSVCVIHTHMCTSVYMCAHMCAQCTQCVHSVYTQNMQGLFWGCFGGVFHTPPLHT